MAFNNKSKLPDTPWHVGYAYKDEHDPRRHKARCIHLEKSICHCRLCGCYMTNCVGSSHCKFYVEGQEDWDEFLEDMKTDEERKEEAAEYRANRYRREKQLYVKKLLTSGTYTTKYHFFPQMLKCPFCGDKLKNLQCKYCLAKFKVVTDITDDDVRKAAAEGIFLIKRV